MTFELVTENRKQYLDLLLLADEQEDMIDRYLDAGDKFVLRDPDVRCQCVVADLGGGEYEVKSLSTAEPYQRQGYGRAMLAFVKRHYQGRLRRLILGTGDSPITVPFHESCGFTVYQVNKDYMLLHYDRPIFEKGRQLRDQVMLEWRPVGGEKLTCPPILVPVSELVEI